MISVLMSIYKESKEYLKLSIESILNQSLRDFEYIIVIDNPENYEAIELIRNYSAIDNRIKIINNEYNLGLTKSLNRALENATGEYIARMDADDISETNRFELQLDYLKKNDLDLVGCSLRRISESGEIVNSCTNSSYSYKCIAKLLDYDNCVPHPSWFGKKELFDRLNGYRDLHSCEDYDFLLRAKLISAKIGIVDQILLNYRINTNGISRSNSLKQMLSSHYLQKNLFRISDVDQKEIDLYLAKRLVYNEPEKYEKSLNFLNHSIECAKNKKIFHSILLLLKATTNSKYCIWNVKKICRMLLIKRGSVSQ